MRQVLFRESSRSKDNLETVQKEKAYEQENYEKSH